MEIAAATGLTYPFFAKISNILKTAELITAIQGRHGGYVLGRPGSAISLYDVIRALEGEILIHDCLQRHENCAYARPDSKDCKLRRFLCGLQDEMIAKLAATSLADMMDADAEERMPTDELETTVLHGTRNLDSPALA